MAVIALSILAAASLPARAQGGSLLLGQAYPPTGQGSTPTCFEVVAGAGEIGPILVNRCTGATWFLAREAARGGAAGDFSWRWHPIGSAGTEVILGYPGLPGSPNVPVVRGNRN
jgi:hypothetical protein